MTINFQFAGVLGLVLIAIGAVILLLNYGKRSGQRRHMDALLAGLKALPESTVPSGHSTRWTERLVHESAVWLGTRWGQQLVADEDRFLLVQCGYQNSQSRAYFLLARIACSLLFPMVGLLFLPVFQNPSHKLLALFAAAVLGFLAPKWFLRSRATKRCQQAARELPVLVDLLGLLQGAGLGVDQSLHLIAKDFRSVMPVLTGELEMANRLHASGRTREQALIRMSEMFQSDALADLAALIVQIDKHGGAVQEPLRQFGDRLREQRRMRMKEDIGKITVKMTVVMVLTLLPSLLIITAGPGFLSVVRALGGVK